MARLSKSESSQQKLLDKYWSNLNADWYHLADKSRHFQCCRNNGQYRWFHQLVDRSEIITHQLMLVSYKQSYVHGIEMKLMIHWKSHATVRARHWEEKTSHKKDMFRRGKLIRTIRDDVKFIFKTWTFKQPRYKCRSNSTTKIKYCLKTFVQ